MFDDLYFSFRIIYIPVEDDFEFPIMLSRNKIFVQNHKESLKKHRKKTTTSQ